MIQSKKSRIFLLVLLVISLIAPAIPQVQAAEGDYTGDHWDTSGQSGDPYGITTDGSNIWIVDPLDDKVYKYTMAGVFVSWFSTIGHGTAPVSITTDGSNIWVSESATDEVYKYTMAGVYVNSWDTSGQSGSPYGITTDGSNIWIFDITTDFVYKYTMAGVYTTESWTPSVETIDPYGIATDGSNIWVVDKGLDEVFKYTMDGTYTTEHWDVSGQMFTPYDITTDGINIWIVEEPAAEVYKYEGPPLFVPPSDPDLLFGAGFNASSPYVDLHWNHSLVDVQFFEVQNSSDGVSWTYLGQSNTANYTDSQVVNGTMRYYKVRACNQTGGTWYNSSFTSVDFETVYFIPEVGAGEAHYYLGEFIDDYENEDNVSVKSQVIRNSTLDCMELNYTAGGIEGTYIDEWDASDATGFHVSAMGTDGNFLWISNYGTDEVYKFYMNGTYTGEHWNTLVQGGAVFGVCSDSSNIWTVDYLTDKLNKYTMGGVYVSQTSIAGQSGDSKGVATDGNFIWVIDSADSKVYKYTMAGGYTTEWFPTIAEGANQYGITTDGTNIWTVNLANTNVSKYTMAGVYVSSWDHSGQSNSSVYGIASDGAFIWLLQVSPKVVFQYDAGGGGYANSGYFTTTELLSALNGTALVLLTNTTLNSGTLKVQFSDDNATWVDHNDVVGSDTIIGGNESIDLRDLDFATIYLRYNFTRGGAVLTPRLFQTRLISTEGTGLAVGVGGVNRPTILIVGGLITIVVAVFIGVKKR